MMIQNNYVYGANGRSEMVEFLPDSYSTVLEIGSGYGVFRRNLNLPHEYWGVELNPKVGKSSEQLLDRVLLGSFNDVEGDIPDGYFDLVICNDVIEHMSDPSIFLKKIRQKMKTNANLIGSIPNVRHLSMLKMLLIDQKWEYTESGIMDRTHLRFFSKKDIATLLNNNQFTVHLLNGINGYKPQYNLKYLIKLIIFFVFGQDLRYIQFGFRASYRQN